MTNETRMKDALRRANVYLAHAKYWSLANELSEAVPIAIKLTVANLREQKNEAPTRASAGDKCWWVDFCPDPGDSRRFIHRHLVQADSSDKALDIIRAHFPQAEDIVVHPQRSSPPIPANEIPLTLPAGFQKHDAHKLRYSLLPLNSTSTLVKVLMYGADKYGADNWHKCDDPARYHDALLRHLASWRAGEISDPESDLPHLAHATACALFLLGLHLKKTTGTP